MQPVQQIAPAPNPVAVQALAQAMAQDISGILNNHNPTAARIQTVTPIDFYTQQEAALEQQNTNGSGSTSGINDYNGDGIPDDLQASDSADIIETILIPAGEINYAQIMIEANSDVPGPVLAQLMSGPLVGSRIIGSFTVQDEYLILSFNTIVIDGISSPISAVAIDPNTTLPGVATEVNRRYWQRVFLPAAARFIEGIGSAIAEDTETTVTVSGDTVIQEQSALDFEQELGRGVEEGFEEIADFMDEEADRIQVEVRVSRGTPIGVFFTEPVTEAQ